MLTRFGGWIVALVALVAVARVAATYAVFNHTYDEPNHIAAGMEWLERGTFTFEAKHPPLGRVAAALGPYLAGARLAGERRMVEGGHAILYGGNDYTTTLALARAGILPFFILAIVVVWVQARRWYGELAALFAALLFTTTPPVLAHAGVATTDMALTGPILAALLSFTLWVEARTPARAMALGAFSALAVLAKLSALLFLPAGALTILGGRWLLRPSTPASAARPASAHPAAARWTAIGASLGIATLAAFLVLWAGYRFSVGRRFGSYVPGGLPIPAPELIEGIRELLLHNEHGQSAYLFGEFRRYGWWYFFPVALAVKSPIPLLVLGGIGTALAASGRHGAQRWALLAPALAAAAILAVCMPAPINVGVRHVLPMYPLMAVMAGYGAARLWTADSRRTLARLTAVGLVSWQMVSSAAAHPDYLPYFNAVAGRHPERILLDSDLDWGQDLQRLADTARARRIPELSLAYFGTADVTRHGLPSVRVLKSNERVTGWVAASETVLTHTDPQYAGYRWLNAHAPVARVGKSIALFYIRP
jgi:4-amino-4-deoxy-L-arabinose transferase-like glycosyltransferase